MRGPVRKILRLRLRMTMGTAAPPACHPEPRAKDLVLEGSKMGAVREILRLRLRMTMDTAAPPACHPEPRAKDLVLEGSKMGGCA